MSTITNNPGQINTGAAGDTIIFAGGSLAGVTIPGGRNYVFKNVTALTITGQTFDNFNLALESCSKVKITGNTFKNLRNRSGNGVHVIFTNQLTDADISLNTFQDQIGSGVDTCIFNYDPRRVTFNRNHFYNVHEGIHTFWFSFDAANPWNCETSENECVGIERHFIETQGCANGYKCERNHVSKRFRNGINLSIATGGLFNAGGYQNTANIVVNGNVLDNSGFPVPDYSQCMGIELMGRAVCTANVIVNGGQGIAYTYNPPNTLIDGNKFKGMAANQIVTDVPHDKAGTITGVNDFNYGGLVPTAAQLIGTTTPPPPPPPPPPPAIAPPKVTAYFTKVKVVALAGAKIERRAGVGGWQLVTLDAQGFDTKFPADQVTSKWKWYYIQTANGFESDEVEAQIGINPDPVVTPPQPIALVLLPNVPIKRSDGTTVMCDVPFVNGQPDYTKATVK